MSTLKGTTMHPRCRHIGETYLNVDFSSSAQVKFNFELLKKKKKNFWFPWCSTREDLSVDVSITNVGLILTKLWWFHLFVESQNSNFELFWKKIKFWDFHGVVLVKTFPLMYTSITNVGLILTKLRWFLFSGYGQMDRRTDGQTDGQTDIPGFGILIWKHVGTQKIPTQSSKLVVSCRSLYASPEDGDA